MNLHLRPLFAAAALAPLAACSAAPRAALPYLSRELPAAQTLSIAGRWQFAIDPVRNAPPPEHPPASFPSFLHLPGSIQEQDVGDLPSLNAPWTARIGLHPNLLTRPKYAAYQTPGDFKTPFWLTPERVYVGAAWFQRDIDIPAAWKNKHIRLFLERPHWETALYVDGRLVGTRNALGTPHKYELPNLAPGRHRFTLRVDNSVKIPVGLDASSITDQTQTNWNGIVGDLRLVATDPLYLDNIQLYPNIHTRHVRITATLHSPAVLAGPVTFSLRVTAHNARSTQGTPQTITLAAVKDHESLTFDYDMGANARLWDEFSPNLYDLHLSAASADQHDAHLISFGLREVSTSGTRFLINGRKTFLRGTLECAIFPLTGYPPTDVASWKREMSIARSFGLNHMRFHSWCPPEAAFEAADQLGMYLYVECSCWTSFGNGGPLDAWVKAEAQRMLATYSNHPSFIMMSAGNESMRQDRNHFLTDLVASWVRQDPRHLYTAAAGWPNVPTANFQIESSPRSQATHEFSRTPQTESDYRAIVSKQSVPILSHEIGQWCVYPDFQEIPRYTGTLKPGNLEIFQDFLNKAGMGAQAHDFLMASGKFQAILYKEEIEAALRTPGFGGFDLLDLHDFPGQGTAPVGVLNAFWDTKGYITAKEYSRFCNATVPLLRLPKRVFTSDETLKASAELSHFGPADLHHARASWSLTDDRGDTLAAGRFAPADLPTGALSPLGTLSLPLSHLPAPARLTLRLSIDGTPFTNDWQIWVYPPAAKAATAPAIYITTSLDDALSSLAAGKSVLFSPDPATIASDTCGSFAPIFWNRITFTRAKVHTLSILCNPKHPAFREFPTDFYTNWQWFDLLERSRPIVLNTLPRELTPILQIIDDWDTCRKLGLLFEANVGRGRLIFSAMDLTTDLSHRPATAQLRRSLLAYMRSSQFSPRISLPPDAIRRLISPGTASQHHH